MIAGLIVNHKLSYFLMADDIENDVKYCRSSQRLRAVEKLEGYLEQLEIVLLNDKFVQPFRFEYSMITF